MLYRYTFYIYSLIIVVCACNIINESDFFINICIGTGRCINRGVRKDNVLDSVHVIYGRKHKGVGVRRDCVIHMIVPPIRNKILLFSSPCVCGSLTHSSPRSTQCFLCPRFMDP